MKLYDSNKKKFVSQYLSGKIYKNTRADTVQSLFPLLLDLPEFMKQEILAALEDVMDFCNVAQQILLRLSDSNGSTR